MKFLWYLGVVLLGAYGLLAIARTVERLMVGADFLAVQPILGLVALFLAWKCLGKAKGT